MAVNHLQMCEGGEGAQRVRQVREAAAITNANTCKSAAAAAAATSTAALALAAAASAA